MTDKVKGVLEKIVLAGIGAMALTAEKAKEIVNDMIAKGELSVEQGKAINEELKYAMKARRAGTSPGSFTDLDRFSAEQLDALKAQIRDIEAQRASAPGPSDPQDPEDLQ